MPLINFKVELKLEWTLCLSPAGADNTELVLIKLFLLSKTKNYMFKIYRLFISMYQNEYKTKSENKNTANEYRYFLKSSFFGVNRLFVFVYLNRKDVVKQFNA